MNSEQPDFMSVTITFKVTPQQRAEYAADSGVTQDKATAEMRATLRNAVDFALSASHMISNFMSYSVSEPQ